jgi:hypothetical protein
MATLANQTKNTVVIGNLNKMGAGWIYNDAGLNYEMPELCYNTFGQPITFANKTKHSATITNQIKN